MCLTALSQQTSPVVENIKLIIASFFLIYLVSYTRLHLIHQLTNALNTIPFLKIIELLHVSASGYILREFQNKETNSQHFNLGITLPVLDCLRGGADKSLAHQGRKQATATKLGIYSIYSPRNSIHFLAHCSNFCKSHKKNHKFVRLTRYPRQKLPPRRTKNGDLSIAFSVQGTGGSPKGPDPENRVGDQDTGSPGRPVSSGLQVPGETGHCRARTRPPW